MKKSNYALARYRQDKRTALIKDTAIRVTIVTVVAVALGTVYLLAN